MYVLSHGSGLYYIVVNYCMVYSTIAPSRSDDAIMQCDGAIWCKDVMGRWRDSATVRWLWCNDVVVRWRWHGGCSGALVRWRNDDDAIVRQCDGYGAMTRWYDDDDATVRWSWYDDAMTRWHDGARGAVREDSKAMLCRVIISICFIAPSYRVIEIFVHALFARKLWRQTLIFIRQILDRVLSIPKEFIILTYCCRIIKMFQLLFIFPRSYKSEKDGLVNEVNYLNPNQQTL